MGFFDILSDIYSSVTIRNVDAEEPPPSGTMNDSRNAGVRGGASSNLPAALDGSSSKAEAEANKADAKGGDNGLDVHLPKEKGDEGEAGDDEEEHEEGASKGEGEDKDEEVEDAEEQEEEEEEEEEEPVDIKPKLEDECASSTKCSPHKHHYDDCVERVTGQVEEFGKAKEDCVEEFFHLAHCASDCAAPKLFARLK